MSYSPGIGLILNLGVDASGVDQGLDDANKKLGDLAGKTGKQFADAGEKTDKALLSNKESARLLSEELGIHLPRAVSAALSEILPEIGSLGTALLGAFAVEEVIKFVGWVKKTKEAADGLKESEEAIGKAVRENDQIFEMLARKSIKMAQEQLRYADMRLLAAQREAEAQADIAEGLNWNLPQVQTLVNLYHSLTGHTEEEVKAQKGLKEITELRGSIAKILLEDHEKANEKAAAAAKKRAAEAAREAEREREALIHMTAFVDRLEKERAKWHEELMKSLGMPEEAKFSLQEITRNINSAGLEAAKTVPSLDALTGGFHKLTEAERAALPVSSLVNDELLRSAQHIRDQVQEIEDGQLPAFRRIEVEYKRQVEAINREIAASRRKYELDKSYRAQNEADEKAYTQAMVDLAKQRKQAEEDAAEATAKGVAADVATFVGAIAGRKAEAEVEGAFFLAEGAYDIARGAWPPNPALIARGLGEMGAGIEMLKAAGKGGSSSASATGGGVGTVSMEGGRTGPQAPGAMGSQVPITPGVTSVGSGGGGGGGSNITVHVYGPHQEAAHIAGVLNNYTTRLGGQLVSSRSISPPKAGR